MAGTENLDNRIECDLPEREVQALKQEDINKLIVEKAKQGGTVVRLKGGDPFIFGRGGEEALELKDASIAVEIVNGVSSGYGVPTRTLTPATTLVLPIRTRADPSALAGTTPSSISMGLYSSKARPSILSPLANRFLMNSRSISLNTLVL